MSHNDYNACNLYILIRFITDSKFLLKDTSLRYNKLARIMEPFNVKKRALNIVFISTHVCANILKKRKVFSRKQPDYP